ncbi:MAG: thioredoxin-dependent thiol peroxidase [Sporomusaceae bacterium]|nr:thioredoxin-dependent thiol peroxidase [Sporomusaceae bacterium]
MSEITENMIAPDFSLPAAGGQTITLSDLKGRRILLYFYPKDNTPGCTIEAQEFNEIVARLEALNVVVLGVSRDTVSTHEKFQDKHSLTFALLSDSDAKVCELYGVMKEKNMYGKKVMGIERSSFLIDETGKITKVWRKVKAQGHAKEVLAACAL